MISSPLQHRITKCRLHDRRRVQQQPLARGRLAQNYLSQKRARRWQVQGPERLPLEHHRRRSQAREGKKETVARHPPSSSSISNVFS